MASIPSGIFRDPLHKLLVAVFAAFWIYIAIAPTNRADWLLENVLVLVGVVVLAFMYRRLAFSNLSLVAITLFLVAHVYGSHTTYAEAPLGYWLQDVFETERNHYDRIVHFSFGLLLAWPMREVIVHLVQAGHRWVCLSSVMWIVALSTIYELIEWAAVLAFAPELGAAFLGTQGDVFDAQKDTGLATLGAIISMSLAYHRGPAFAVGPKTN
jgi:putative membrane protein